MPYTKTIQIKTWKAFRKLYKYLQNRKHKNHAEYELTRLKSAHPKFTARMLRKELEQTFHKITGEKRNGAPIKNLFALHIVRMPAMGKKKNWLTPEERDEFARRYVNTIAPDGLALWCWHINRGSGEDDLNVLVANITDLERPRARRRSDINHIDEARDTADMITNLLNEQRRAQDRKSILTMPERQRQIVAKEMGIALEEQLARHPVPVYLSNLREVLQHYGHEVPEDRFKPENDSISIRLRRLDNDDETAAKRRRHRRPITELLGEVARLRRQLQLQRASEIIAQLTPEQERAAKFRLPRDKYLDDRIEEWSREPAPRAPEPPQEPPQAPGRSY